MGDSRGEVVTVRPWTEEERAVTHARIIELRRDDYSFEEIGVQLWESGEWPGGLDDPPSKHAVWQHWRRALRDIPAAPLAQLRAELGELLAEQYRRAQEILDTDHVAHSNGEVVYLGNKPVLDNGPKLAAIREQRMIVAQMSTLSGANAPVQQKITMDATVEYSVVGVDVEALK
jgi:hypothetical protein